MYEFEKKEYFEPSYDRYDGSKKEESYFATGHYDDKNRFGTNPAPGESHV